jgi:hypothetical protein
MIEGESAHDADGTAIAEASVDDAPAHDAPAHDAPAGDPPTSFAGPGARTEGIQL